MKPAAEAQQQILQSTRPLGVEVVDVFQAHQRVLAEHVKAPRDLPPWDNSAVDGYAVRNAEAAPGTRIPVQCTIAAGDTPASLPVGQAVRIMTGAPVPPGADAVIMREEVDESRPDSVVLSRSPRPGENLRRRGEDVAADSVVLQAGTRLGPAEIGMLCSVGRSRVRVVRQPVVAILSTGNEIAEVGEPPNPARIINGNAWMLAAQVVEAGGIPRLLGIAADTRDALAERMRDARGADVLLTIGGVSVGDFDFVKEALEDVGATMDFWRVAIRPGKPLAVGSLGDARVFGLPGNPVSCFVTFELFVRPALRTMQGFTSVMRRQQPVVVQGHYEKKPGLMHFVRARLERKEHAVEAHLHAQQSSGALTSICQADALVMLPEPLQRVSPGESALALVLRDDWERSPLL